MQSDLTWHSCTFDVSLQVVAKCVAQADAAVHDVPSAAMPHWGYVPLPSGTSTPQQTGVEPSHPSGPSHAIWSGAVQLALATQPNVVVGPGIEQQTVPPVHVALPAQPNMSATSRGAPSTVAPLDPHPPTSPSQKMASALRSSIVIVGNLNRTAAQVTMAELDREPRQLRAPSVQS